MIKIISIVVLSLWSISSSALPQKPIGKQYPTTIISVKDGDTVVISANYLPLPLKPILSVRIYGVDTPEKAPRAQCVNEDTKGQQATAFTKSAVANAKKHELILYGWDKFGGRVLGDILLDGVSLRSMLIKNNLARPYFGEVKQSWCE